MQRDHAKGRRFCSRRCGAGAISNDPLSVLLSRRSVDPVTGCWEYTGRHNAAGYGMIAVRGREFRAHRLAALLYGIMVREDSGIHICHHCDNPPCFNPAHLFAGDPAANMRDKMSKGRARIPRGEANARAKLTAAEVTEMRALYAAGGITQKALGQRFGVSKPTVQSIMHRRSWAHVA